MKKDYCSSRRKMKTKLIEPEKQSPYSIADSLSGTVVNKF